MKQLTLKKSNRQTTNLKEQLEEYKKIYWNEKEYKFISYEIDYLPDSFQIIDDLQINENEILNLGSINFIEHHSNKKLDRDKELLKKIH